VLVSAAQGSESSICIYISPSAWTSLPLHSHPPLYIVTEHRAAELPVLYSKFPLAIHFTHGSIFCQSQSPNSFHPFPPCPSISSHLLTIAYNPCLIIKLVGVQGTPATIIGDELIPGAVPWETLEEVVKEKLAAANAQ